MRVIDIIIAALGLVLTLPLMLLLIWLIRRETPGGALFRQTRIGKGGKPFTCLKFRTMFTGTGDRPTHQTGAANITRTGQLLRRLKLDELPQLINVLKGEMAIVGPRPCLPSQTELIAARTQYGALDVLPGITGLAQIEGVDMSSPARLAVMDGYYAANRTICMDLMIMLRTLTRMAAGRASTAAGS